MARTIGKRNIRTVKSLTKQAIQRDEGDISSYVHDKLPDSMYDIWEGSYNEIERIINDTIME